MNKQVKCIEYYFDSNEYNELEVLENMQKEKLEFPKKKAQININLNEYGIYVATLEFINNKIAVIKKNKKIKNRKVKLKENKNEEKKGVVETKVYGRYKETRKYSPI